MLNKIKPHKSQYHKCKKLLGWQKFYNKKWEAHGVHFFVHMFKAKRWQHDRHTQYCAAISWYENKVCPYTYIIRFVYNFPLSNTLDRYIDISDTLFCRRNELNVYDQHYGNYIEYAKMISMLILNI